MNARLYSRLAARNMRVNARFYLPYLLAIVGMSAGFYIIAALALAPGLGGSTPLETLQTMLMLGGGVIGLFMAVFLLYTNSFLIRQRRKELGLYQILGMEKRHIAAVLVWEALYTACVGLGLGIPGGIALYKLAQLLIFRFIHVQVVFGFYVSTAGIAVTAGFFALLLALTLIVNLFQIRRAQPVELLRGGRTGEREPRARLPLTLAGLGTLGYGYWIALHTQNAIEALSRYFLAVVLVVVGTYCLFTSVSIAVLKLLRANKRFYYRADHFISVSGMLYRMKQNAVGMANICVLSTMVMVMISGTVSLYMGTEEMIREFAPSDIVATVTYDPTVGTPDLQAISDAYRRALEGEGVSIASIKSCEYLSFTAAGVEGGYTLDRSGAARSGLALTTLSVITADAYAELTGAERPELDAGEILIHSDAGTDGETLTFFMPADASIPSLSFRVAGAAGRFPILASAHMIDLGYAGIVVRDEAALHRLYDAQRQAYGKNASSMRFETQLDSTSPGEALVRAKAKIYDCVSTDEDGVKYVSVDTRAEASAATYGLNGSFLFLGVFLGLLLILATVLILYYKQISEGYADQKRFEIMQKVGLSRREARRTINRQMLAVFFLPLLAAAMHIAFDFRMLNQLLGLFSLTNARLTLLCSLATLGAFTLVYGVMYALTAKVYARIVR